IAHLPSFPTRRSSDLVVLDVVGREPPFQRSEVAIGKGLSEEFAHDGFVALRVVRHASVLLRSRRSHVLKAGSAPQKSRAWGWGWLFVARPSRRMAAGSGQRRRSVSFSTGAYRWGG